MTNTPSRRPRASAESLERAIVGNTKALAEHRRAAGRTLSDAQVAEAANGLLAAMTGAERGATRSMTDEQFKTWMATQTPAPKVAPTVETAAGAKARKLTEAIEAEPAIPLHKMSPEELNADAARRWAAVLGPMAG